METSLVKQEIDDFLFYPLIQTFICQTDYEYEVI